MSDGLGVGASASGPNTGSRFEKAAVELASRGYYVFPIRARAKQPPLTPRGFKDATRDERQILQWWDHWPDANIGVACGASGIAVLDIDSKHGADPREEIPELGLEDTPTTLTGEAPPKSEQFPRSLEGVRGAQVFFAGSLATGDTQRQGVEIRGEGSYVVVPPSVHPSGVPYEGELPPRLPPISESVREIIGRSNGKGPAPAIGEKIPKGEQHRTLASLAGTMRRRGMGAEEIAAALKVTNRTRLEDPASDADIEKIARSIGSYPAAPVDRSVSDAALTAITDGLGQIWIETKNGKKMIAPNLVARLVRKGTPIAVGGAELYRYERGVYLPDGERFVQELLTEILADHWRTALAGEVLTFLYHSAPRLWDRPPLDRVNVRNGIIDLATGVIEEHSSEFLSPVQIGAAFDPDATCPAIDKFIGEVLAEDLRETVHELAGYLLTPDNSLKTAVMMLGGGDNGKSKLLSLLSALLGGSNVSTIALQLLDESQFATAGLYGKLANIFADLDARALKSTSRFKMITGGDAIPAERKFKQAFSFVPFSRMLFSANEAPTTPDSSDAYFTRWLIVPFEQVFKDENADRNILAKLTTESELSGLLNHAVAALPKLLERGRFEATTTTKKAAAEFRLNTDVVAAFVDEHCKYEGSVGRSEIYTAFVNYCQQAGRAALGNKKLYGRVRALGQEHGVYETTDNDGARRFVGIQLLPLRQRS